MKVMVVQIVCPSYKAALFRSLCEENEFVFYIGDKGGSGVADTCGRVGFKYFPLRNIFFTFLGVQFLWQKGFPLLELRNYDVVILPSSVPCLSNYLIATFAFLFRCKVGYYGMGLNYQKKTDGRNILDRIRSVLFKLSSFSIVYTQEIKRRLIADYAINSEKIYVAPNTLDVDHIAGIPVDVSFTRKSLSIPDGALSACYVGRLSREKQPEILLDVVEELNARGFALHLVFAGSGPEEVSLKNSVAQRGLNHQVRFIGQVSEDVATAVIKSVDYVLMPGMTGLAVVHAFSCQKTYITVNSDMHSPEFDYIVDGENAWVIACDAVSIADKIVELVENPDLKQAIEECAYSFAINNLSLKAQVDGFVGAVESVTCKD